MSSVLRLNIKGKNKNLLAFYNTDFLMYKYLLPKDYKNISFIDSYVKSGTHKSLLPSFMYSIRTPPVGFEPTFHLSVEDCLIQLDDRGVFIYYKNKIIIDNISNIELLVN